MGKRDYGTFKVQFDAVARANRWDEQEKKTALIQSLTGHTTEIITTLTDLGTPITFEALDEMLVKQYSKKQTLWERKRTSQASNKHQTKTSGNSLGSWKERDVHTTGMRLKETFKKH